MTLQQLILYIVHIVQVENLDHLGLIAGVIDELGVVDLIAGVIDELGVVELTNKLLPIIHRTVSVVVN